MTWHFLFPLVNISIVSQWQNLSPQMPVVRGPGTCDPLHDITNIWVFICDKNNSTAIKHVSIYMRTSLNIMLFFNINGPPNLTKIVPVIGMECMVPCARLRHRQNCLMPGIYILIKPAAMEKLLSYSTKSHTVMLRLLANSLVLMASYLNCCAVEMMARMINCFL